MRKKKYITPCMKVVNTQTYRMIATSQDKNLNMKWSGNQQGDSGPDEIDDYSTFDSF